MQNNNKVLALYLFFVCVACDDDQPIKQTIIDQNTVSMDQMVSMDQNSMLPLDQSLDMKVQNDQEINDMLVSDMMLDQNITDDRVIRDLPCDAEQQLTLNLNQEHLIKIENGALIDSEILIPNQFLDQNIELKISCSLDNLAENLMVEHLDQASRSSNFHIPIQKLSPILKLQSSQPLLKLKHKLKITHSYSAKASPINLKGKHVRLLSVYRNKLISTVMFNPSFDLINGLISYESEVFGDFQLAYAPEDLSTQTRQRSYKSIAGISMGAGASAVIASKYFGEFDYVGALGGAIDWRFLSSYIYQRALGGFCASPQLGEFCEPQAKLEEFEHPSVYNAFYYSPNGGDFHRSEYVKLFKDLGFAYGNPTLYHPLSPYTGNPLDLNLLLEGSRSRCRWECRGDRCTPPDLQIDPAIALYQFYDDEFNPDGMLPVIPFCDEEDGEPKGVFDQSKEHLTPVDTLLAVDINLNGRRDENEPIIRNFFEPFDDFGCDGLKNEQEPGFDPISNPDPHFDDFDWYLNPFGTENNFSFESPVFCMQIKERQEQINTQISKLANLPFAPDYLTLINGESFRDYGLDGVLGTAQIEDGGYDWGEGDGIFNLNPNYENMLNDQPLDLLKKQSFAQRKSIDFWVDGGIRDIFNFGIAGLHFVGQLHALGKNLRVYRDFKALGHTGPGVFVPSLQNRKLFTDRNESLMLFYGNENANEQEILDGDGGHIGTASDTLNRFMSYFHWQHNLWDSDDRTPNTSIPRRVAVTVPSEAFKGTYKIEIVLPPGYDLPENAEMRYPVVLFLHGYGQSVDDLPASSALYTGFMKSGVWDKTIFIYPDGSCGKNSKRQCNDGVDNDGDGLIDANGDPECGNDPNRQSESSEDLRMCNDGVDNDEDGDTDLADPGCVLADEDDEGECVVGSFYSRHVGNRNGRAGGRDYQGAIIDALRYVDQNYRTLGKEIVEVQP